MNKIILGLSLTSFILGHNGQATDFDTMPASNKQEIKDTQDTYISYGVGVNKNEINIIKHEEDQKALASNEQYKIYEQSGNFEKGRTYKITYKGDFVTNIEDIK